MQRCKEQSTARLTPMTCNSPWPSLGKPPTLYLLHVSGEALGLVLRQSLGLVSARHLGDGLLEELGQLQLGSETLLLLLLLQTRRPESRCLS